MEFTTATASPHAVPYKHDIKASSNLNNAREAKRPRTADVLLEEQLPNGITETEEQLSNGIVETEEQLPDGIIETEEEKQKHWFVGSIDQGTTSTRFLIFNGHGEPVASHQIEFENKYPHSG